MSFCPCRSNCCSSRLADSENLQTQFTFYLVQGVGPFIGLEPLHGQVGVLQVFQVRQDGLTSVKGLGPPGFASELGEAGLDGFVQADGEHGAKIAALYMYSNTEKGSPPTPAAARLSSAIG